MKKLNFLFVLLSISISGFSLAPTISSFSPVSGPVGTLVTIKGTNLSSPTSFTIGGVSAIAVSDVDTVLVGMVMPGAVTGRVSITTLGGADTANIFTVTSTPYPSGQQGPKLIGTGAVNGSGGAVQGNCVALSADGNTAIVGGDVDNSGVGAVWIYTRSGTTWAQQGGKLTGTGAVGTMVYQGWSLSLSADGSTAIVGGYGDNSNAGAVWVFTRSGTTWTQQGGKLTGTGAVGAAYQGYSVSLSADGNMAIVGGFNDNNDAGAAWIYTRSGTAWTQQGGKLTGTGAIGSPVNQGSSVALSADGNTAIVGGFGDNNYAGAAWVYTRSGTTWMQQGNKLTGTGAIGSAWQGRSVSLSADGNTAIVGALNDNGGAGAAWVYTRSGTTWTQQGGKLTGTGAVGAGEQGASVGLTADGNTAIVGGYGDNNQAGATWVYTRSGSAWAQQGSKLTGSGAANPAYQGWAVALSADGSTAMAGGDEDNSGAGAAWVFSASCSPDSSAAHDTICSSALPYIWNGLTFATSGTQTANLTNHAGCDSAAILVLTVHPSPVVTFIQTDTAWEITAMAAPSLSGGSPIGGHYSGPFVTADSIVHISLGTKYDSVFTITYNYTDSNGCTESASHLFRAYLPEGISDITGQSPLHLYPNPNKGSFTLETSGSVCTDYIISDMLGHVIMRQAIRSDKQVIELPEAAEGVYSLVIKGAQPMRFVIVR
jgi:hypothetical protein